MEKAEKLSFSEVKTKIGEHLKIALNIEEFAITFAKQEDQLWRVNVEFKEKLGAVERDTTAFFSIDATTGEVIEFEKGRFWRF